jgi:hypothetical protein
MMNDKQQILTTLREEFNRWETMLAGLSEAQITAPQLAANLSIKDVVAHLRAWQQRSVARMEAALHNREPEFPRWPAGLDAEPAGEPHQLNAWIYETYRDRLWSSVHRDWKEGFLRLLELGEAIPEKDLLDTGKYPWLEGHPLSFILLASYEHHHIDHLEPLLAWIGRDGNMKIAG